MRLTSLRAVAAVALAIGANPAVHAIEPTLVAQTIAGSNGSRLTNFSVGVRAGQPALYFQATDGYYPNVSAWVSNGSAAGTYPLVAATVQGTLAHATDGADVIYQHPAEHAFFAHVSSAGVVDAPLIDFGSGALSANASVAAPTLQSRTFLQGGDSGLWRTDGTAPGTVKLASSIREVAVGRSYAYFEASDGSLKRVDATSSTVTDMVRTSDHWADAHRLAPVGDGLCMKELTNVGGFGQYELYCSIGATTSVQQIVAPSAGASLRLRDDTFFTHVGGSLLFPEMLDYCVWTTDGTPAGTVPLTAAKLAGTPISIASTGTRAFFFTVDGKLWTSTGATAQSVIDMTGSVLAQYGEYRVPEVHGTAFFVATLSGLGNQLVASDGSAAGTFVIPAPTGYTGWQPTGPVAKLGSTIVFAASTSETGEELWAYGPIDLFGSDFE